MGLGRMRAAAKYAARVAMSVGEECDARGAAQSRCRIAEQFAVSGAAIVRTLAGCADAQLCGAFFIVIFALRGRAQCTWQMINVINSAVKVSRVRVAKSFRVCRKYTQSDCARVCVRLRASE